MTIPGETLWAKTALTAQGWADDVIVEIDTAGRIASVATGPAPANARQVGILLPAPTNLHSHAFQRAMAGLTEARGPDPQDSFWTWRRLMYQFLDHLTPDDIGAITAFVQMEMLEAGYGAVCEFHYLHHQPGGAAYDDRAEMSARVASAAEDTGIGLTLLPVAYQFGGCDGRGLGPGQARFGNEPHQYAQLLEGAGRALAPLGPDAILGVAPHSLRAVSREHLADLAQMLPAGPFHMHLAEQVAEVDEIKAHYGVRPVAWLLDNHEVDARWCLIHLTQMEPAETEAVARTGAVAGLCPITEASLGDGIFDGLRHAAAGGRIGIGSDSNIRITLCEELRMLEYSQRLRDRGRAMFATPDRSTGRVLFDAAAAHGAQAAGRDAGRIEAGAWADLLELDATAIDMIGKTGDTILDAFIFAGSDQIVRQVWSAGRHVVADGRHRDHARITARYGKVLGAIMGRI